MPSAELEKLSLLQTKLYRPPATPDPEQRTRLIELLDHKRLCLQHRPLISFDARLPRSEGFRKFDFQPTYYRDDGFLEFAWKFNSHRHCIFIGSFTWYQAMLYRYRDAIHRYAANVHIPRYNYKTRIRMEEEVKKNYTN